ncbi:hypothetical protein [Amycolatopsis taiwanensis]|uniref:Uncharacterized protein n=1 Tax=Amycolatopsis taiwanensis TaxID=342230 RepID=A0A9W6R7A1_9PSEU|nr:hypothetical protein [Amycolatopsis taiwanensis]GLY68847.1 hypothetical protein Atai01_54660 [Amycolatopsis taiwanensis]
MTDFRDGEDAKAARERDRASPPTRRQEVACITPKPPQTAENNDPDPVGPGLAAARIRVGVVLPSGRIAGRTDQIVHVVPLPPASADPAPLKAFCGMPIEPGKVDFVTLTAGPPCTRCLLVALENHPHWRPPQV